MKPTIKFGLINGGIGCLWSLLMYITGLNRTETFAYFQWIGIIIPIILIVIAVKEYRVTEGNGWVSYGEAFRKAMTITSIGAVIGSVFHFIYLTVIDPAYVDFQLAQQMDKMADRGMSDEVIESAMATTKTFMTPGMQFVFALVFGIIFALIISAIMAAILKKPNPDPLS